MFPQPSTSLLDASWVGRRSFLFLLELRKPDTTATHTAGEDTINDKGDQWLGCVRVCKYSTVQYSTVQ